MLHQSQKNRVARTHRKSQPLKIPQTLERRWLPSSWAVGKSGVACGKKEGSHFLGRSVCASARDSSFGAAGGDRPGNKEAGEGGSNFSLSHGPQDAWRGSSTVVVYRYSGKRGFGAGSDTHRKRERPKANRGKTPRAKNTRDDDEEEGGEGLHSSPIHCCSHYLR